MRTKPIELILLRRLASRLPLPAAIVDAEGTMVYVNPATERLLGWDQAAMGEFPISRLEQLLGPSHSDGSVMAVPDMPLAVALHDRRPQQSTMVIHGTDGVPHRIVTTAVPLDGQGGTLLGAMSIFWEEDTALPGAPPAVNPGGSGPPIELLLLKQVAGYLATPVFVVDADGALDYYNEPAEALLGMRYEETGQLPLGTWGELWSPTDPDGRPLPPEELPLAKAVSDRHPVQGAISIRGSDGTARRLTITAVPLEGADGSQLGAFAIFWAS